jgi:calcineurin-like phosphoesterase family protein
MTFVKKYYTADTHFGHPGMLTFGGRPFASTDEMDRFLIEAWNSTVGRDDICYHLGDFAVGDRDPARIKRIFDQLHGRKYLIIGNHDVRPDGSLHPSLTSLDWAAPPTAMMEVHDEGQRIVLCHYGMRVWNASHHGSWHFYGHSHGSLPPMGRSRDVGVDCPDTAFCPRTFRQLTASMDQEIAA